MNTKANPKNRQKEGTKMDYKRNKRFFDPGFTGKLKILAIIGALVTLIFMALWYFVWISSIVDALFTIGAIIGIGMIVGAISIRPKLKDITDQIENAGQVFTDDTAEKLKFPNDFGDNSHSVWGFCEGTVEKTLKNGDKLTDRVEFTTLYLRRSSLYVRTQVLSLTEESSTVTDYSLPLAGMTVKADETAHCLLITTLEDSLLVHIRALDYPLEEYIEKIERQIKKSRP